jgi:valyl-tRNA synthetase
MDTYKLVWDDFCAWYLEMVKPAYQQDVEKQRVDAETLRATVSFFENILKILHPFMPFLTEELWHDELFGKRPELDCCIVAQLPEVGKINTRLLEDVEFVKQIIAGVRNIRNAKQIAPKEKLNLSVKANSGVSYNYYELIITKLANIDAFDFVADKPAGAAGFMVSTDEFYVPLEQNIDPVEECAKLQKEKVYLTGFLNAVNSKLGNERFMANAKPEVIEVELKKKADTEAKLQIIEESLAALAC